MKSKCINNKVIQHIIGWAVYAGYVYLLNLLTNHNVNIIAVMIYILPFIGLFYVFLYFLRKYRFNKIKGALAILCLFVIFSFVAYVLLTYITPIIGINILKSNFKVQGFLQEIIRYFIQFLVYAILFFMVEELLEKERKVSELEKEKHKLELEKIISQKEKIQYQYAFLRAQINPHFLYNTLNVLYSQALSLSENMAENIMKVSELMRYSLDNLEMENMKIPVHKEIKHLEILLSIYRLRYADSIYYEMETSGIEEGHYVPPLSLITVVENAFKYGDLSSQNHPMLLNVDYQEDCLVFICKNKKKKNYTNAISHNIGLSNLKQRLDFAFQNKYHIDIQNDDDFYMFKLKIFK